MKLSLLKNDGVNNGRLLWSFGSVPFCGLFLLLDRHLDSLHVRMLGQGGQLDALVEIGLENAFHQTHHLSAQFVEDQLAPLPFTILLFVQKCAQVATSERSAIVEHHEEANSK